MFQMQISSSVGTRSGSDSEPSKEKLKIQNIIETLCPRLCESKAILQEIIWALTPGRRCKKMTQALAERAVEVTSNISKLLEGAEETSQHLDGILQLERTLRDIYVFVQSETQRNLLLRVLFAKDLRVRYFSLDKQLRGLLNPFEQTVTKKPLVLCATTQEDHPGIASHDDVALAEILPPNNTSAIHASCSFFNHANNPVVHDGNFYNAQKLVIKQGHSCDRTPQGIVEGADVFTLGDVLPKKEIYKGRGYRVYCAHSTAKARAVKIKLYEGSCAKDRCLAAAIFSQKVMHPNVLHLIGVSPLNSELPFLVFDESSEWAIESIIASALSKGLTQSLFLGLQTVAGLSSGLDYLRTLLFPFASVGLDHFVVTASHHGNILISFDPEVLPDEVHEQDQRSNSSNGGIELGILHGLCQKTFDAACKAHYEFEKVQRSDLDELDADHDLDQDRFEEIEVDTGTLSAETKGPISEVLSSASSAPQLHAALPTASSVSSISPRRPLRKSSPSARRRELVWKSQKHGMVSLEEISRQFQNFLLTFSTQLEFNRRRGRYTTKTAHRCPGYSRIEITLTPDIAHSAIVSHLTPTPHEICPVCKEIVKDAEIFACICGRDDDEFIPTIRCSTCSEWHHRPCVSISENEDQSFVCRRCKVQTNPRTRAKSDDEEALISSLADSTLTRAFSIKQPDIHLETTLSPPGPVCAQKRALLIGIQYYDAQLDGEDRVYTPAGKQLKGPHVDVQNMRQLLLDCYGYDPEDITVLIDDGNPNHVQPTKENLIRSMKDLVADARSGDRFYLHFSGHRCQLADADGDEEDGWDECILTCDHETIVDDTLNELLVAPLPVGSTFVSSFDSCYSGTVLDLMHYRCNRVHVPWVNKGVRRNIITRQETRKRRASIGHTEITDDSNTIQVPTIQVSGEPAATPNPIFCTGRFREELERDVELKADLVSLSANLTKDHSWENAYGSSMTEALIKVLRNDPHSSLKHILTSISYELHTSYMDVHVDSRGYKDAVNKINIKRKSSGKPQLERRTVEMNNFQNPQFSSHHPLDMNRSWPLALSKPCVRS